MNTPSKLRMRVIERSEGLCEPVVWIRFWTLSHLSVGLGRGSGYVCVPRGVSRLTVVWLVPSSGEPKEPDGREQSYDGHLFLESRVENHPFAAYASMAYARPAGSTLIPPLGDGSRRNGTSRNGCGSISMRRVDC